MALLSTTSVMEAALVGRVSERTIFRWLKRPEFRAAVNVAARAVFEDGMAKLRAGALEAADTITQLRRRAKSEAVRLRAAVETFSIPANCDLAEVIRRLGILETSDQQKE